MESSGAHPGVGRVGERGAALVEMAVTLPILLSLILGIITFGVTNHQGISLEGAAREAARFGATYPVADAGTIDDWLHDVATVAENAATGSLPDTVSSRVICVAQGSGTSASDFSRLNVTGTQSVSSATSEAGWCFTNDAPGDDTVVQVKLERLGSIQAFVFSMTPTLNSEVTTKFERTG